MAIRTDYRITDEEVDGLADVSASVSYDVDQGTDVLVLHQNGSEISLTPGMAKELQEVIGKLVK